MVNDITKVTTIDHTENVMDDVKRNNRLWILKRRPRNAEEIQKCVPGKATARVGRETPPRRGHFHQLVNRESYYVYVGSYDAPTTATRFNKNENDNDNDDDDDDDATTTTTTTTMMPMLEKRKKDEREEKEKKKKKK
uniref:Uncharacterized protein n=1 Tax=Vespula pensylvanica TaxID=30213 RepID=A0A834UHV3_VESPE|nr:hypothetical protein H0235_001819 [Vespula pensylvanica]